jgi:hypothetical protein
MAGTTRPFLIALVVTAAALCSTPAGAAALNWVREESRFKEMRFAVSEGCGPDTVSLTLPDGAYAAEPARPVVGALLDIGWDSDNEFSEGHVRITGFDAADGRATWTGVPEPGWCQHEPPPGFDGGWETLERVFRTHYLRRHEVTMTLGVARNLTYEALSRRFSFLEHTYGYRARCRLPSRHRARCKARFLIGDGVYQGTVRSSMFTRPRGRTNELRWRYRLNMVLTDEYCVFVSHDSPCRTRYTRERNARFPVWALPGF